eukprot:3084082-Prymnesium_polylepis.1
MARSAGTPSSRPTRAGRSPEQHPPATRRPGGATLGRTHARPHRRRHTADRRGASALRVRHPDAPQGTRAGEPATRPSAVRWTPAICNRRRGRTLVAHASDHLPEAIGNDHRKENHTAHRSLSERAGTAATAHCTARMLQAGRTAVVVAAPGEAARAAAEAGFAASAGGRRGRRCRGCRRACCR